MKTWRKSTQKWKNISLMLSFWWRCRHLSEKKSLNKHMTRKRWIDATISMVLTGTIGLGVTGCAFAPPDPDIRLDGMPLLPKDEAARIMRWSSKSYSGHPFNNEWKMHILSIDGKPVPQSAQYIQVSPGKHSIEYECTAKFAYSDTGGGSGQGTISHTFIAGQTVYGYVRGVMNSYKKVTGSIIESTGTCSSTGFSIKNPYFIM